MVTIFMIYGFRRCNPDIWRPNAVYSGICTIKYVHLTFCSLEPFRADMVHRNDVLLVVQVILHADQE